MSPDIRDNGIIDPENGGEIGTPDGKATVKFPAGAVNRRATATIRTTTGHVPRAQFDWTTYSFNVDVRDEANRYIATFPKPVDIEVSYTDEDVAGLSKPTLSLYRYDEGQKQWVKLPSQVDLEARKVTGTTDHFTDVTFWGEPLVSMPASIKGFQTDLFTGAGAFSLPLEVPPGPNGLQPSLTLNYSSATVDEMKSANSKGSWVGIG